MKKVILISLISVFTLSGMTLNKDEEDLRRAWNCLKCLELRIDSGQDNATMIAHLIVVEQSRIARDINRIKAKLPPGRGDQIIQELAERKRVPLISKI